VASLGEAGGGGGATAPGDTLMEVENFVRLNYKEHWTNDELEGGEGGSGWFDEKGHHFLRKK